MKETNLTIDYYNKNAKRYCKETSNVKMTSLQCEFILRLPCRSILDLGCGSGRDSKFFKNYGCIVIAVDGSTEMCKLAEQNIGQRVICNDLREYAPEKAIAGIWANASLLHLTKEEIKNNVIRLTEHLLPAGCFYMSFKYGNFSGERNGRFYTDFDETSFSKMLSDIPSLLLAHYTISDDLRSNHSGEKWLNVFCMKKSSEDHIYTKWNNEAISDDYFIKLCENSNIHEIINAVNNGANLYAKDNDGNSFDILREIELARYYSESDLIFSAVKNEDLEVVKAFLELGISANISGYVGDEKCKSALTLAVQNGNFEIVKTMLEHGANIERDVGLSDTSALAMAIRCKNIDMLQFLLNYSSDTEIKNRLTWLALISSIRLNALSIIKFLLEYGADANLRNDYGKTALMLATELYSPKAIEAMETLLQHGADVNAIATWEYDYNTALISALSNNYNTKEKIRILLKAGAETLVPVAGECAYETILKKFHDDAEIVRFSIKNCTDDLVFKEIFSRLGFSEELAIYIDEDWKTAIAMIAYNEEIDSKNIISDIKRALAELHMFLGWKTLSDRKGNNTALIDATSLCSKEEIISALLTANPDNINAKDSDGWTALMCAAAFNENPEIISQLLNSGADIKTINNKGQTALDLARENGNNPAIELLEAAETNDKIDIEKSNYSLGMSTPVSF